MRALKSTTVFVLSAFTLAACQNTPSQISSKDWCISGGSIYAADDANTVHQAVAVRSGIIRYAGNAQTQGWCENNTTAAAMIDLGGAALYPGFTDGHGHLLGIGLREMTLNLEGTKSAKDLQDRLAAVVAETAAGETIYGRGWIETHWPEGRFPNRADLDAVAPDNPVILERSDGHAFVVNSAALKAANITRATPDPFGGAINKDSAGEPDGMLIDNAGKLIESIQPVLTDKRKEEAYVRGSELYASRGWTNIHSMSVDPDDVQILNRLANEGKIKIRIYNSLDLLDKRVENTIARMDDMEAKANPLITTHAIKLYSDGALGSRGAALLEPYSDDDKNKGLMLLREAQAQSILVAALRNGIQVNTHAIGDRANRAVLDWYKKAFDAVPVSERKIKEPRWRIEHSQIIDTADIPRFAEYGVIASMQPSHAIGDLHFAVDRLGPNRLAGAYAWRSLIDSGAVIVAGSDAPVEVGDPRIEFYAATQRMDLKGYSNENWNPEQRVTRQEALKMFSSWAAYGAFEEDKIGTIEVGKEADFTAFKQDMMVLEGPAILDAEVLFTMVNGEMAFDAR